MYKKMNRILGVVIVGVIFLMSMGYSVLNRELNISGELTYRPVGDIRITDVTLASTPENTTLLYSDFSKKQINIGFKSSETPAKIDFTIEVTNFTNTEMGILKIDNLPNIAKIDGYTLKTKLANSKGSLKAGESTTFTIAFNPTVNNTYEYILKFDFEPVCKVTYNGFKDTTNFKSEVLYGDTFTQDFGSDAPKKVEVTMSEVTIENYTYSNSTLTIPNVNGNIEITAPKVCEFPSYTDSSGANAPVLNGDMIPVVYSEECRSWIKQDLNKSYDYSKQIWANAVTVSNEEKLLKKENINLKNPVVPVYKSTNQQVDDSISNLTLTFTTGSIGGNLYFDYSVESEELGDYLTIQVIADTGYLFSKRVHGLKESFVDLEIEENTTVAIIIDYKKNASISVGKDTATISNLVIPANLQQPLSNISTGDYQWSLNYDSFKYSIGSSYERNVTTGIFLLKNKDSHEFSVDDIGKYICDNASSSCNTLYKITKVEQNIIKEVEVFVSVRNFYKSSNFGTVIDMEDINTMWVWIPRYSYTIKSEDGKNYYGKASFENNAPSGELPGEIDVKFIKSNENDTGSAQYTDEDPTNWHTNEAFNFGEKKENGIWVGKFETTGGTLSIQNYCVDDSCDVSNITIKPGERSLSGLTVSSSFFVARSMQVSYADVYGFNKYIGDLHMMKNDEWGAILYLSQSKYGKYGNSDYNGANKEVYINNSNITGNSGGSPKASRNFTSYAYNDTQNLDQGQGQAGCGASSTGTIYGVYDMNGGLLDNVMGVLEYESQVDSNNLGQIVTEYSGFKGLDESGKQTGTIDLPDKKYYNSYKSADPKSQEFFTGFKPWQACNGGVCYGHGLSEVMINDTYTWYNGRAGIYMVNNPWLQRGGEYSYYPFGLYTIFGSDGASAYVGNALRMTLAP